MPRRKSNERLVDDMLSTTTAAYAMSGHDGGTLRNLLRQNSDLREMRAEVLRRMSSPKTSSESMTYLTETK